MIQSDLDSGDKEYLRDMMRDVIDGGRAAPEDDKIKKIAQNSGLAVTK